MPHVTLHAILFATMCEAHALCCIHDLARPGNAAAKQGLIVLQPLKETLTFTKRRKPGIPGWGWGGSDGGPAPGSHPPSRHYGCRPAMLHVSVAIVFYNSASIGSAARCGSACWRLPRMRGRPSQRHLVLQLPALLAAVLLRLLHPAAIGEREPGGKEP